jgi:hypothetical protein
MPFLRLTAAVQGDDGRIVGLGVKVTQDGRPAGRRPAADAANEGEHVVFWRSYTHATPLEDLSPECDQYHASRRTRADKAAVRLQEDLAELDGGGT